MLFKNTNTFLKFLDFLEQIDRKPNDIQIRIVNTYTFEVDLIFDTHKPISKEGDALDMIRCHLMSI